MPQCRPTRRLLILLGLLIAPLLAQAYIDDDSIDFIGCFQDLAVSDADTDGYLQGREYETFLQLYSIRACQDNSTTTDLSLDQLSAYQTLSCHCRIIPGNLPTCCLGQAARIDISGAPKPTTSEQYAFLRSICKVVDATIPEPKCRAPTAAPSVIAGVISEPTAPTASTNAPSFNDTSGNETASPSPIIIESPTIMPTNETSMEPAPSNLAQSQRPSLTVAPSLRVSSAPAAAASPSTIMDYESCYLDMLAADTNFNNAIGPAEYFIFAQAYSTRVFCHKLVKDAATQAQTAATFQAIACLCETLENATTTCCDADNAQIDATAIFATSRSNEQTMYLEGVCLLTDESLSAYNECNNDEGGASVSPSIAASFSAIPSIAASNMPAAPAATSTKAPTAAAKTPPPKGAPTKNTSPPKAAPTKASAPTKVATAPASKAASPVSVAVEEESSALLSVESSTTTSISSGAWIAAPIYRVIGLAIVALLR